MCIQRGLYMQTDGRLITKKIPDIQTYEAEIQEKCSRKVYIIDQEDRMKWLYWDHMRG